VNVTDDVNGAVPVLEPTSELGIEMVLATEPGSVSLTLTPELGALSVPLTLVVESGGGTSVPLADAEPDGGTLAVPEPELVGEMGSMDSENVGSTRVLSEPDCARAAPSAARMARAVVVVVVRMVGSWTMWAAHLRL
jgi:hypothetical protein